jgi:hypothetical protein
MKPPAGPILQGARSRAAVEILHWLLLPAQDKAAWEDHTDVRCCSLSSDHHQMRAHAI